ncbi:hypothetical protein TcG_12807 [Trypanosoma cruzi]|nr:hypothetical protein TcG_12807 [Trypanosoma cruzi]
MRVTHKTIGWAPLKNNQTRKKKEKCSSPCTVPHTYTVTITVILSTQSLTSTPRSPQHTPLQHRPRDRRALPAQAVRHALPLRRNVRHLLPVKQRRVLHDRRHAPAAQRHNVVPPLLHNHGRNANAYWRTCSMRWNHPRIRLAVMNCILLSSLCLGQTLPSSRSTAWVLREAAERCHFCGRSKCAETTATHAPSHLCSLHSPTHKGGVMGKKSPPHNACTTAQTKAMPSMSHRKIEPCAQHTHGRDERDGRIQVHAAVLYFPPRPRIGRTTHSDARRTPSALLRAHSAGRRPVTLVPSQWGAQAIVVADHRRH